MDMTLLGAMALQAFGWLYLVGGAFAAHLATVAPAKAPVPPSQSRRRSGAVAWPMMKPLPGAEDAERRGWRLASALMFMFAGAAMAARDEAAPATLAALVVQQIFYLVRQRIAELERARSQDAYMQRPSILTTRVFVLTTLCAMLATALHQLGALR